MRRSAGDGPLLVASLAAAADDGVDAATLAYLTRRALVAAAEWEKRKEKKEKAEAKEKAVITWKQEEAGDTGGWFQASNSDGDQ